MPPGGAGAGAHVLVFPYPAQGHMLPLLDFAGNLAAAGVSVTVLVTPKNLPFLTPLLSRSLSVAPLVLPFPSSTAEEPSFPAGIENVKDLPPGSFRPMMLLLAQLYHPLLRWFQSHPSPPDAIISDMFLGWTHRLAVKLAIPRIVFSPSGALALSLIHSVWRDMPGRTDHLSFPEIPGSPKYPWWQLSPIYRSYVAGEPASEFIKDGFAANRASWGLAINSFDQLEGPYLNHLKKELGHHRVWAVGPSLPPPGRERDGSASVVSGDIIRWLDTCGDDDKVVYVCFGSQAVLTNQQTEALAVGLEKSGARFVWTVKEPTVGHVEGRYGAIPSGFEDRVSGRGVVIRGWAPQVAILSHRAVGAFLTHCGWNSVMEGLVAGVSMLAWPMGADQFSNATLVADVLKAGRRVCEGAQTVPDSDELAQAVAESLAEEWAAERLRAKELREAAFVAIGEGGSSFRDLSGLVNHLSELKND